MMSANRIEAYTTRFGYKLGFDHSIVTRSAVQCFWQCWNIRAGADYTYKPL